MVRKWYCKRTTALALTVLSVALATVSMPPVQTRAETTLEKLEKAKQEKEKTEEELESHEDAVEGMTIKKDSLLGELSLLNDDLQEVSDNLAQIESDINTKLVDIENTQNVLDTAIETQDAQYEAMKVRIKYIYEEGNSYYLELLLSSKNFGDFLNKGEYIESLSRYDRRMLEEYKETVAYVEQTKAELEQQLSDLVDLEEQAKIEQQRVEGLVTQTSQSISQYADQIEDAQETIDTLEDMIEDQSEDIEELQKQYEEELRLSQLARQSTWRDISEITFEEGDRRLLANIIYCEAGGEPYEGKLAVGAVVINRVLSSRYPNTVVGVIYQNKQFSPVASGRLALALAQEKATQSCYQAADEAMSGVTNVGQCLYFRTPIEGLTGIQIGGHIFY